MSAQLDNLKPMPRAKPLMEVTVKGKIQAARRHEKMYYSRLVTPAPDAYTRPQIVQVRSKASLGRVDDEITVECRLGGFTRKPFRVTDKDSGETEMVTPVDLTLDVVE